MKLRKSLSLAIPSALFLAQNVHAINWSWGGENNLWSNPNNWEGAVVPNSNADEAAFLGGANVAIEVDQDFTVRNYFDGFGGEGFTHTLYGPGTLTIDRNSANNQNGINNATGDGGGTLRLNGFVTINNVLGGITNVLNVNSPDNVLLFDTNSSLKIMTRMQTITGSGGTIFFNGRLIAGSTANLLINSANVFFEDGHDSSNFGNDITFFANSKLTVNGGKVLNNGRKFQVNGSGGTLELNAEDAINNANIVVGATNNFRIHAKSNQSMMGVVIVTNGTLTLEVDPAVTSLSFKDSASQVWGTGGISIIGFKENTIRFGTNGTGLTAEQLAVIDGGAYRLSDEGYLTAATGQGYDFWAITNGIVGEPFEQDFNQDGISNGVAYALGLSPTAVGQVAEDLVGNAITFNKGADAITNADVSWIIETSETLSGPWIEEVVQIPGDATPAISYELITTPGTPKKFARLKVVKTP